MPARSGSQTLRLSNYMIARVTTCAACPANTYSNITDPGNSECLACPAGSDTQLTTGNTNSSACVSTSLTVALCTGATNRTLR